MEFTNKRNNIHYTHSARYIYKLVYHGRTTPIEIYGPYDPDANKLDIVKNCSLVTILVTISIIFYCMY